MTEFYQFQCMFGFCGSHAGSFFLAAHNDISISMALSSLWVNIVQRGSSRTILYNSLSQKHSNFQYGMSPNQPRALGMIGG